MNLSGPSTSITAFSGSMQPIMIPMKEPTTAGSNCRMYESNMRTLRHLAVDGSISGVFRGGGCAEMEIA